MSDIDADLPLVAAARQGDAGAFAELVKRHSRACFRIAARSLGNTEDAEDVVQEAFTRAYQSLPRFRGEATFRTWVLRITHHLAHDQLRGRKRRPPIVALDRGVDAAAPAEHVADRAAGPARESSGRDDVTRVRSALDELPFRQKSAILLKVYEGLSYSEVARVLGTTVGAARVYLSLARRALRRRLARLWSDSPSGPSGEGGR